MKTNLTMLLVVLFLLAVLIGVPLTFIITRMEEPISPLEIRIVQGTTTLLLAVAAFSLLRIYNAMVASTHVNLKTKKDLIDLKKTMDALPKPIRDSITAMKSNSSSVDTLSHKLDTHGGKLESNSSKITTLTNQNELINRGVGQEGTKSKGDSRPDKM